MIKPMEERHISAIARLEQACFAHPWSEQALRDELENEQAVFFVAEDETGRLMDTPACTWCWGNVTWIIWRSIHHFAIRAWAGRFCGADRLGL